MALGLAALRSQEQGEAVFYAACVTDEMTKVCNSSSP